MQFSTLISDIGLKKSSDLYHVTYGRFSTFSISSQFFNRLLRPEKNCPVQDFSFFDRNITWALNKNYWKFFNPCAKLSKINFSNFVFANFFFKLIFQLEGWNLLQISRYILRDYPISLRIRPITLITEVNKGVNPFTKVRRPIFH